MRLAAAVLAVLIMAGSAVAFGFDAGDKVTVDTGGEVLATLPDGRVVVQVDGAGAVVLPEAAIKPKPTPSPSPDPTPDPTVEPSPSPEPTVEPTPDPTPEPSPEPTPTPERAPDELGPARLHERDCGGTATAITAANDTRYVDCPGLSIPVNVARITVVGDEFPTGQLKGVRDVYFGGRPGRLMERGPRSDGGDLLQIKRWPATSTGTVPDGITLRWVRFHDLTRPASGEHTDGIQVMAGLNGRILDSVFERIEVQPIFFRVPGVTAGGGPIDGWSIERTRIDRPTPTGYFAVRIAGNGDQLAPRNIMLRDLDLGANVSIDRAATVGFSAERLSGGSVSVNNG